MQTESRSAPNAGFTVGQDDFVVIQPRAEDNFSLARVEFYVDGSLADTASVPPYSTRWKIAFGSEGRHTLLVRAYDAAGNSTDSTAVTITVK